MTSTKSQSGRYRCSECGTMFDSPSELRLHEETCKVQPVGREGEAQERSRTKA